MVIDSVNEDLIMYLRKLVKTIETQALFSFGNIKIVNQTRVDDILCCVDINFPRLLHGFQKEYGVDRNLHGLDLYQKLINNIKIKPPFVKTVYAINYNEVLQITEALPQVLKDDIAYIKQAYPNFKIDS